MKARGVSGETPKRELAWILADYESGKIDVLINAQLLAEGWNSPRATICMHLAPTASKRIYHSESAASPAATRARRRGSSSISSIRRPSTTTLSSRCIRCLIETSIEAARS